MTSTLEWSFGEWIWAVKESHSIGESPKEDTPTSFFFLLGMAVTLEKKKVLNIIYTSRFVYRIFLKGKGRGNVFLFHHRNHGCLSRIVIEGWNLEKIPIRSMGCLRILQLLGERSEPHTGVFNRDFAWYILYIYMSVCMSVVVQKA